MVTGQITDKAAATCKSTNFLLAVAMSGEIIISDADAHGLRAIRMFGICTSSCINTGSPSAAWLRMSATPLSGNSNTTGPFPNALPSAMATARPSNDSPALGRRIKAQQHFVASPMPQVTCQLQKPPLCSSCAIGSANVIEIVSILSYQHTLSLVYAQCNVNRWCEG